MRVWMTIAILLLIWLAPEATQACSVCFSGTDENRTAFLVTTGLMTFLPLIMIGSVVAWLVVRARRMESASIPEPTARHTRSAPPGRRSTSHRTHGAA